MFDNQTFIDGSPVFKSFDYKFDLDNNSDFYRYYLVSDPIIESGIIRNIIIFPGAVVNYAPGLVIQPNTNFNTYARLTCFAQGSQAPILLDYPFSLLNPFYGVLLNAGGDPGGRFPQFNFKIDLNRSYWEISNNGAISAGTYMLRFQFIMK